jgi:hypothetical protein
MEKPVADKTVRKDLIALWGGIAFSILFTVVIWWAGRFFDRSSFTPDQGASWYFWKLPNPTFWSHFTAWALYLLHQISMWVLIYLGQKKIKAYTTGLNKLNIIALSVNALFIVLHFVQSHIWYDGLAQDVSIWSSQVSVIIMLVWILLMENKRRGLFVGKAVPFSRQITDFARKYHGYYFAWAAIYTFWYHPMENTWGHLLGFLYMFLLLLQGSLFFTRVHNNRWWTLTQEVSVLVHGTIVAIFQGNSLWPMFFFGFAGMFVITQMHGLGLKRWVKWLIFAVYIGGAAYVYYGRGVRKIYELISIPLIEYLGVFILAGLFALGLWIAGRFKAQPKEIKD